MENKHLGRSIADWILIRSIYLIFLMIQYATLGVDREVDL